MHGFMLQFIMAAQSTVLHVCMRPAAAGAGYWAWLVAGNSVRHVSNQVKLQASGMNAPKLGRE
jgi:hypothetical protein